MRMEVRCCCDAKLLGHLEVPENVVANNQPRVIFELENPFFDLGMQNTLTLEIATVQDEFRASSEMLADPEGSTWIQEQLRRSRRLALKANHASIDQLKMIPGFEAA